jgi:hypothetical protein
MSIFNYIHQNGGLEKTITTGLTVTWEEWCRLTTALEAKAQLAEQNGLPATAKSWRSTIENLHLRGSGIGKVAADCLVVGGPSTTGPDVYRARSDQFRI